MFLAGVAGAGVFGALTVSGRILVVQTIPAVAGFALVVLGGLGTWCRCACTFPLLVLTTRTSVRHARCRER